MASEWRQSERDMQVYAKRARAARSPVYARAFTAAGRCIHSVFRRLAILSEKYRNRPAVNREARAAGHVSDCGR